MKKLFTIITLLFALVGSVFAQDFIKYGSFKSEKAGTYDVYFDIDAREPYDIKEEKLLHFLYLQNQDVYSRVSVCWMDPPDEENWWSVVISKKHNVYRTLEIYEEYDIEEFVCNDGSIIQYVCYKNK